MKVQTLWFTKLNKIHHNKLEMQRYLKPNNLKIRKEEAQTIFKMRSRVTDVKINYKGKQAGAELCQAQFKLD